MVLLWHLKAAHHTSSTQARRWVGWSYLEVQDQRGSWTPLLRMWCTLALGGAIPPFWLLQALSNWLTLGCARSSAQLAACLWLHSITWNGSLRNNRLKGLETSKQTAPEFFLNISWVLCSIHLLPAMGGSAVCGTSPFQPCYTVLLNFTCIWPSTGENHDSPGLEFSYFTSVSESQRTKQFYLS